jgi:hypothetical protein
MPQRGGCRRRRRLRRATAGGLLGVAAGLFFAGPLAAQTLTEAFAYAYNNNPQLLA